MSNSRAVIVTGIVVAAVGAAAIGFLVSHYGQRLAATEEALGDAQSRRDQLAQEVVELELALEEAEKAKPTPIVVYKSAGEAATSRVTRPKTEKLDTALLKQLDDLRTQLADARAKQKVAPSAARVAALDLVQEGDRHFAGGNLRAARIAYLQALEKDPDLADPHLRLGMIHEFHGHGGAAVASYEEYVRLRPESKYSRTTAVKMGTLFEETASTAEIYEMEEEGGAEDTSGPVVIPPQ